MYIFYVEKNCTLSNDICISRCSNAAKKIVYKYYKREMYAPSHLNLSTASIKCLWNDNRFVSVACFSVASRASISRGESQRPSNYQIWNDTLLLLSREMKTLMYRAIKLKNFVRSYRFGFDIDLSSLCFFVLVIVNDKEMSLTNVFVFLSVSKKNTASALNTGFKR